MVHYYHLRHKPRSSLSKSKHYIGAPDLAKNNTASPMQRNDREEPLSTFQKRKIPLKVPSEIDN